MHWDFPQAGYLPKSHTVHLTHASSCVSTILSTRQCGIVVWNRDATSLRSSQPSVSPVTVSFSSVRVERAMRAHDTAWAVLLCLICMLGQVSPQVLVLSTNDDGPPHAAPPSSLSPPPSPPSQPAHPLPPMAATSNATASLVSCTGLATEVFTECSAIPGRYVSSENP